MPSNRCNFKLALVSFKQTLISVDRQWARCTLALRVFAMTESLSYWLCNWWLLSNHEDNRFGFNLLSSRPMRIVLRRHLVHALAWVFAHWSKELLLVFFFISVIISQVLLFRFCCGVLSRALIPILTTVKLIMRWWSSFDLFAWFGCLGSFFNLKFRNAISFFQLIAARFIKSLLDCGWLLFWLVLRLLFRIFLLVMTLVRILFFVGILLTMVDLLLMRVLLTTVVFLLAKVLLTTVVFLLARVLLTTVVFFLARIMFFTRIISSLFFSHSMMFFPFILLPFLLDS